MLDLFISKIFLCITTIIMFVLIIIVLAFSVMNYFLLLLTVLLAVIGICINDYVNSDNFKKSFE